MIQRERVTNRIEIGIETLYCVKEICMDAYIQYRMKKEFLETQIKLREEELQKV